MSKFITILASNVFPIGNVMVRGFMVYIVAGSFFASLQLTNNYMAPVSSIADTENFLVLTGKYKIPHCILMLLSLGYSTFSAYIISTGYVSFPIFSTGLCLDYSVLPFCYWVLASKKVFARCTGAYIMHPDNT